MLVGDGGVVGSRTGGVSSTPPWMVLLFSGVPANTPLSDLTSHCDTVTPGHSPTFAIFLAFPAVQVYPTDKHEIYIYSIFLMTWQIANIAENFALIV